MRGVSVAVLPPKTELSSTGIRVPKALLKRLEEIAGMEDYSRNEVILYFLEWALKEYEKEKTAESLKKKGH